MTPVPRSSQYAMIAMAAASSFVVGRIVLREMFVEGLTDDERSNVLKFAGVGVATWAISKLVDLDKYWYLSTEKILQKAGEATK